MSTTEVRATSPYPTPYPAPADAPMEYKMFIGGEWVESESGERFDVFSPGDGSLIGSVPKGTAKDAQSAIAAARKAQKEMAALSIPARAKLMEKASAIATRRLEHDARVLCRECGKTIVEARSELGDYCNPHYIEAGEGIKRYRGRINPSIQEDTLNKRILVIHQPMGVIGVISPWNWPADIPNIAITHALAAGNAVVIKPASTTPYSALMLAEIYEEAGFPKGSVNVVTGPGPAVGEEIVANPGTNAIHFTGETVTGRRLTQVAGIKRLMLELGGNGPLVVWDDANIDAAVEATIVGCFYLAGQVCTASERILVHQAIHDEFVEKLVARAKEVKVGNPLDEDTDMGPLNNLSNVAKVKSHYDDAREHGGKFLMGGNIDGMYSDVTIVDGVTSDFLMARDETFGPVAPIITFKDMDECLRIANETPYGLQGAAFTSSLRTAFLLGEGIECGTVLINETNNCWDQLSPFGGVKQSGLGRELSDWCFDEVTETKQLNIDISKVQ
jgi:succinate-semialdehyde dehydrogenase / glutarate-semialdehyde dehydrogenase